MSLTRKQRGAVALAVGAAAAIPGCGGSTTAGVLPDLRPQTPREVSIEREEGVLALGFRSATDNVGRGALVVDADWSADNPGAPQAVQVVYDPAGDIADKRPIPTKLVYAKSADHSHWHYPAFMRYELRRLDGSLVGPDRKSGFCLGDRYETDSGPRLAGEPPEAIWTGSCGGGVLRPDRVTEGISPGFGDDYEPYLEGQSVELPADLAPGLYRLIHRVNPDARLLESDYSNNTTSATVLVGADESGRPSSVRVVCLCDPAAPGDAGAK